MSRKISFGDKKRLLGALGEDEAVKFLKKNNYRILERNYKSRLGEIDIIAEENGAICFVEVKTRSSQNFGVPQDALTKTKRHQLSKMALGYMKHKRLHDCKTRFDVVSIKVYPVRDTVSRCDISNRVNDAKKKDVEIIKNAFEMEGAYT